MWEGEPGDPSPLVARARTLWPQWAAHPLAYRIETLRRFANVVRTEEAMLADVIARETGRPLWDASAEVADVIAAVDGAVAGFTERTSQRRLEGARTDKQTLRHKPHGVLALITPHCNPASIPNAAIMSALIAGNGVVWKPSEHGMATAACLADLYVRAGIPEGLVSLLPGRADTAQALVREGGIDGVLYTGSVRGGIAIHQLLAGHPERILALHMGGNNPIVVWDTPDLATAALITVQSAFAQSGQNCLNARRLIVRDTLFAPLMAEVRKIIDRLVIDHPHASPAPFMGPVVDDRVADGLTESFLYLMSKGGRPIVHPRRPVAGRPFLTPAIIDVTRASERPDVELFGPVLQVTQVSDFATAIAQANATRYGLVASLIGGSPEEYARFWSDVRAGTINWNRPTNATIQSAPLGGTGLSGNFRPSGAYRADSCAYPVASAETEQLRGHIAHGLAPIDTSAMGD